MRLWYCVPRGVRSKDNYDKKDPILAHLGHRKLICINTRMWIKFSRVDIIKRKLSGFQSVCNLLQILLLLNPLSLYLKLCPSNAVLSLAS